VHHTIHAKVLVSIPVNGTFVVFLKNLCKMVGMLPPNVLDVKVANTESEQKEAASHVSRGLG
jgi:hypothetical protein